MLPASFGFVSIVGYRLVDWPRCRRGQVERRPGLALDALGHSPLQLRVGGLHAGLDAFERAGRDTARKFLVAPGVDGARRSPGAACWQRSCDGCNRKNPLIFKPFQRIASNSVQHICNTLPHKNQPPVGLQTGTLPPVLRYCPPARPLSPIAFGMDLASASARRWAGCLWAAPPWV